MRELTYVARRTVERREAPDPKLRSDAEAIVAPVAATSCDVDSAILAGHRFVEPPFALGHECVARVVETGDAVTTVAPGDLVVVPWSINCGVCDHCRAGLTAHCTAVPHMAMYGAPIGGTWTGLFSDLVRVPYAQAMLVSLPAGLDPVPMASASDNWSLSWRLVAPHLAERPGARVPVVARGQHRPVRVRHRPRARRLRRAVRRTRPGAPATRRGLRRPYRGGRRTRPARLRPRRRGHRPCRPTRPRRRVPRPGGRLRVRGQPTSGPAN